MAGGHGALDPDTIGSLQRLEGPTEPTQAAGRGQARRTRADDGRLETPKRPAVAQGWGVDVVQTLAPRWFLAHRTGLVSAPRWSSATRAREPARLTSIETVLGHRVTPGVTLRAGHFGLRDFGAAGYDHQLGLQLVWARR